MSKLRQTDDGKMKNRESAKKGMLDIRETDDGKLKNRESAKKAMSKFLNSPKGKAINKERVRAHADLDGMQVTKEFRFGLITYLAPLLMFLRIYRT